MSSLLLDLALVAVGYVMGFVMGVWATRDWVEEVAPGTSRQLIELDERQRRNQK